MTEEISNPWDQPTLLELQPHLSEEELRRKLFPNFPNEEQISRFFDVLGRAISVWQIVETALYEVFERAVMPGAPGACGAAFHAIQTFNLKLRATDAAVRFRLSGKPVLLDEWESIKADADTKSQRRNQMVHFVTYIMTNERNDNDKIRLEPMVYDFRFLDHKPRLRMSEISQITDRFVVLSEKLRAFKSKLSEEAANSVPETAP